MKGLRRFLGVVILLSSGAASALSPDEAKSASSDELAPQKGEYLYYIPSSGFIADRTFIVMSKAKGPSAIAQNLANVLTEAERSHFQITVAGKSEAKTLQVLKDAFRLVLGRDLSQLDFTFIGTPNASNEVAVLVADVHGTYHTRTRVDF